MVLAIFVSAMVALYETTTRLIHPQHLTNLWALAGAGVIGFIGNEIAAQIRLRGGKLLEIGMKIRYDPEVDTLSLILAEAPVEESDEET